MYYNTGEHPFQVSPFHTIVAPRPIAWISTVSQDKVVNLAPYAYFNAISTSPDLIMFSAMNRGREHNRLFGYEINTPKDTVVNIRETQEFVINMVSDSVVDAMNATSENVPSEVNEFELAGVTPAECEKIAVPRVLEAPCSLECRLWQEIPLPGDDGIESTMIIGQVLGTHIKDEYILDDKLDISKFTMIGRLGYRDYCKVNEHSMFKMTRPDNYSKGSW